jgi:hypothetical protein
MIAKTLFLVLADDSVAAMLYDLVQCPHRPAMDLFGDPAKRDEINPFIQLLWEKGSIVFRPRDPPPISAVTSRLVPVRRLG